MWQNVSLSLQIQADNTASVTGKKKTKTHKRAGEAVYTWCGCFLNSLYLLLVFFLLLLFLFRLSLSRLLMNGGMDAQPCSASASKHKQTHTSHTGISARAKLYPRAATTASQEQGGGRNKCVACLIWSLVALLCSAVVQACNEWIPCSIFRWYSLFFPSFLPSVLPSFLLPLSLDNDVILNWNKPHQQTTTEGKEGPA